MVRDAKMIAVTRPHDVLELPLAISDRTAGPERGKEAQSLHARSPFFDWPKQVFRPALRPAWLMLALGLAVTVLITEMTRHDVLADGEARFVALSDRIVLSLNDSMEAYEQILRGAAGLLQVKPDATPSDWRTYVASLKLQSNYPGIQGVGYAAVVPPKAFDAFVAHQKASGNKDFRYFPSCDRDLCTSIVLLEPMDWRNKRAVGFDMFSEATRRLAMESARDSGDPVLSGKVLLLQEANEGVQAGTLLYLPLYDDAKPLVTMADRRAALRGFVYSPFRMNDLITKSLRLWDAGMFDLVNIRIYDGKVGRDSLLFDSRHRSIADVSSFGIEKGGAFENTVNLTLHRTPWTIQLSSTSAFDSRLTFWKPILAAILGFLISVMAGLIVGFVALQREAQHAATQRLSVEVAQRRSAQEQLSLAVRELGHRVKNTLTVVTAIASQTVRHSGSLSEFDRAFRMRLQALGRVHDLLTSGRNYATEMGSLVTEVLKPYQDEGETRVNAIGAPIVLPPNTAIMLSVLFNELATNATKYGALSCPSGQIKLSWEHTGDGEDKRLRLVWEEVGGPPVVEPEHAGFGTNVTRFVVERSLGGTAALHYRAEGVRCVIEFPWRTDDAPDGQATAGVGR
jgi:two-component sensor histidine kinase/CHASE1-domain containing sensor protein